MDCSLIRLDAGWAESFRDIRLHALQSEPHSFANNHAQEYPWPLSHYVSLLEQSFVWGALDEAGQLVATLALSPYDPATMQHKVRLHAVYVKPTHRGQSLSRALLVQAMRALPAHINIITLAVDAGNHAAITLYESLGFEKFGFEQNARRYGDDWADDVWMMWQKDKVE